MEVVNNKIHSMEKSFFKNSDELPRLTALGFEVKRVPENVFNTIKEAYNSLKDSPRDEHAGSGFIENASGSAATEIMSLDRFPEVRESILQGLLSSHEAWADVDLTPIACYGIRSYKNGSTLKMHKDKVETHHISCIIIVDEDGEKWPLDIEDHTGKLHHVYAKPGDMIMYESAVCEHGRTAPYPGNFFRNLFVHYSFKNLVYKPE
jgi:prolyl 4-hydroxylase